MIGGSPGRMSATPSLRRQATILRLLESAPTKARLLACLNLPPGIPMRRSALLGLALLLIAADSHAQAPTHPLDGLSGREHWVIYDALVASGRTDTTTNYLYVGLNEPPKAEVLAWRAGQPFRREALVHLIQGKRGYEAVVDLVARKVLSWTEVPGRQYMTRPRRDCGGEQARTRRPAGARGHPQARRHRLHPRVVLPGEPRLLRPPRGARAARGPRRRAKTTAVA